MDHFLWSFFKECDDTPIFPCICCDKMCFPRSIIELDKKTKDKIPEDLFTNSCQYDDTYKVRGNFFLCRTCHDKLVDQEDHLWKFNEKGYLINKKCGDFHTKIQLDMQGFIFSKDTKEVLGVSGSGVNFEKKMTPASDGQKWTKGTPDSRGWFTFTNKSADLLLINKTKLKLVVGKHDKNPIRPKISSIE